jgi:hypothetical protein
MHIHLSVLLLLLLLLTLINPHAVVPISTSAGELLERLKKTQSVFVHESIPRWLVRLYDDPSRQGWVPVSLLERSEEEEVDQPTDFIRSEVAAQRRE